MIDRKIPRTQHLCTKWEENPKPETVLWGHWGLVPQLPGQTNVFNLLHLLASKYLDIWQNLT